ncbi:MAG TPA: NAD(P)/FAD-dependent oxidoreductase [Solirubrobacteraceae bacterium]|jgi:phytoene dehydrogenase-like protein|nr:NAD(P)/FAD-dependent oxidoreductase [Solirubrobacteraceae bacterium]
MADARYDAVVVGGGHHGTIIAPYLARAGLSVLVLERSPHLGGGACASEGPAPGFVMNHCSHWTRFYAHPAYRDFALRDHGLRYVFPDENEGMIFDDGTSFVGFSASRVVDTATGRTERSEENVKRTHAQIARFSARDADTYLELLEAHERHWKQAFRRHRFGVPPPWGTPDPLEELLDVPGSRIEPVHQFMTLRQLAQDFFESPELQILFMRASTTSTGCFADDVPGLQGLVHCLPLTLSFEPAAIAVGGSQAITDALVAAGRKLGVAYETSCEVDRILASRSRATGVELSDGSRVEANVVISDVGLAQTVLRLLRKVDAAERLRRRIRNIHYDRGQLLWANFAIHEPPRYLAEADNAGVGSQPRLYWGAKDLDYLHLRYQPEIFVGGFARRPYVLCSVDSLWDRTRAPEGSHIVGAEEFSAPRRLFAASEWRDIAERFTENLLEEWTRYAPNMTRDNIIASRVYTPEDIQRERPNMIEGGYSTGSTIASQTGRFRPISDLGGHRVLLDNVFECSANLHSGPGIGRGSSYNCFQEIARALRLEHPAAAA